MKYPYTYISCPCTDITTTGSQLKESKAGDLDGDEQERTFNPRSPRANFSLYPIEHLLYCEDCQQIRCPRCTIEEVVCWYCPSCLFESTSTMVKSEGNRCSRHCFDCPVCSAKMSINTLDPEGGPVTGPWILACDYCRWSTLDMGIQFDKPAHINEQITKSLAERARSKQSPGVEGKQEVALLDDRPDAVFAALKKFTSSQIASASSTNPLMTPGGSYNYDSPSSLARIMSLYTGQGSYGKKNTSKSAPMRGSADASEGLQVINSAADAEDVRRLREQGFAGTSSIEQRSAQRHPPHFVDDLLPVPTRLVTKRSKRCRTCRHILVKPETKVTSTRYRIRLIAVNYIPTMSLKALQNPRPTTTSPAVVTPSMVDLNALSPLKVTQFLLTLKNPLFDPIRITLATPTNTPGSFSHKVTILCPQFDIGANTDVWDEALSGGEADLKRSSKILSTGSVINTKSEIEVTRVAEAGKVWDKGRNWATVVVEVVCAAIDEKAKGEEDEDLLEIPIFVRVEYEVDAEKDEGGGGEKGGREKRELAYWTVLGVGKVARMSGMIHSI